MDKIKTVHENLKFNVNYEKLIIMKNISQNHNFDN